MEYNFYKPQDIPAEHYKRIFGIREIGKEMGSPCIYASDLDMWILGTENGLLEAFGGVRYKADGMWIGHLFTYPQYRGKGICCQIIEQCLSLPHRVALASCVKASQRIFERLGFVRVIMGGVKKVII